MRILFRNEMSVGFWLTDNTFKRATGFGVCPKLGLLFPILAIPAILAVFELLTYQITHLPNFLYILSTFVQFSRFRVTHMSMRRTFSLAFITLVIVALGAAAQSTTPAPAQSDTRSQPELLTSDTPRTTPGGATFTVPTGWSIVTGKNLVVLGPPETDTHIAIVDSQGADASAAVAAAWAAYKPEAKRPLKLVTPRPAREGWEERKVFDYETSPNERVLVQRTFSDQLCGNGCLDQIIHIRRDEHTVTAPIQ